MKIKTITCHDVYNYGATLQAYALQRFLSDLGHDVEIIDYRPDYLQLRYNFWLIASDSRYKKLCEKYPFLHLIYALLHYKERFETCGRKKAFKRFNLDHLKLTSKVYKTNDEIINNLPYADIYIAGSDQIWNSKMPNGVDPAFYLDFVPEGRLRASYAASFGTDFIADENKQFVSKMIKKFDYISVREDTGLRILESLGAAHGVHVVDPVLLLSQDVWKTFIRKIYNEKYVLVYDFIGDHTIKKTALALSDQIGCKIYSVNDYKTCSYADKNFSNAGPIEFLELISSASVIISNSFHGTVFSVIFKKPFYVFDIKKLSNNSRMRDFLKLINLSERHIETADQASFTQTVDYLRVFDSLEKIRKNSIQFLNDIIQI